MMFSSFAFQLGWAVIVIISFVRGQQVDQNTAAATVSIPNSTFDKVVDSAKALVARWTDENNPIENSGWRKTIVPSWPNTHDQSAQTLSALLHSGLYPETAVDPSTLPIAIPSATSAPIGLSRSPSATIPSPASTTIVSLNTSIPTISATATSTITVLTTILVQPTPQSVVLQGPLPSTTNEAATEAIQSTTPESMPPTVQIGLGVGIALCVLSLAGAAAFYLWQRRRTTNRNKTPRPSHHNVAKEFLNFRRHKDNKDDAEWSIESVEKVAIVGKVRAQSVLTVSRSNSRRSNGTNEGGTISIGMRGRAPTMALNSHPMTPSYTAFDIGPSGMKLPLPKNDLKDEEELKSSSWPLDK